jgi:hypothetical protein
MLNEPKARLARRAFVIESSVIVREDTGAERLADPAADKTSALA